LPTSTQTPTTSTQLTTKAYVDQVAVDGSALLSSNNTWTGTNAFNTILPTSTLTPTASNQLVTKSYVDTQSGIANATTVTTTNTTTNASFFVPFVATSTTGNKAYNVSTGLQINPSNGNVTASGALAATNLAVTGAAASSIATSVAGANSIQLSTTTSTDNASVNIASTAGGITLAPVNTNAVRVTSTLAATAANTGALQVSGGAYLANGLFAQSSTNQAGAITLNTNAGTSETILINSQQGTSNSSINIVSTAGGITLAPVNTNAVRVTSTLAATAANTGALQVSGGAYLANGLFAQSTTNQAGAITLNTNAGAAETILIRSQQGTDNASINIVSTAGGITLAPNAANSVRVTSTLTSTSGTTGALIVSGGVGVGGNVSIGGINILVPNGTVISGTGNLTPASSYYTANTSGAAVTTTLQNTGATNGQLLTIVLTTAGNNLVVNNQGGTPTLATYTAVNQAATFIYQGTAWILLNKNF